MNRLKTFYGLFMGEQSNTDGNGIIAVPLLFSGKKVKYIAAFLTRH